MSIKWKANKNFKPEIIIEKLKGVSSINDDGNISYSGFEYFEYIPIIFTMIDFSLKFTSEQNE